MQNLVLVDICVSLLLNVTITSITYIGTCFKCSRAYHTGRCKRDKLDKSFKAWREKKNVKNCPRCKNELLEIGITGR